VTRLRAAGRHRAQASRGASLSGCAGGSGRSGAGERGCAAWGWVRFLHRHGSLKGKCINSSYIVCPVNKPC
jgi:hypothetical protein